jgi:hypothetical protein
MIKLYKTLLICAAAQFCTFGIAQAQSAPAVAPVFHMDPNARLVPDDVKDAPDNAAFANKIVIWNGYTKTVTYLSSTDKVKWDTVKLTGPSSKIYNSTNIFVKIYTSATKFNYYNITSASVYSILYDKVGKAWTLR